MERIDLHHARGRRAEQLAGGDLDVLVVGGGILGAGIARDAAMRGLRVGLVEQHDLASGTSSRTSRLLHGGLRYLAQGRIRLVNEASREKRVLSRIAPHLAEPLAFVFPTYRGSGWSLWKLRIGVKLYDLLCGGRNFGPSCSMTRADVLRRLPGPRSTGLTGAVRYYDALTNDARLVLDTLRSAAASGAIVTNYTRLEEVSRVSDGWRCRVRDVISDRPYEIAARSVAHATGPWAEKLTPSSVRLRLTKGVHLVIDRSRLRVPEAIVVSEGPRILFAIPWGERVILGTTDTDYDGPIDAPETEAADVDYVLDVVNGAFPSAQLDRTDVVSTWAGVRPLIASKRGGPSDISRAHQIRMPQPGWLDIAGGKLTTYRLIAEQAVDRLLGHLGREAPPCRTAHTPLIPPEAVAGNSGIVPPERSAELVRYFCADEWAVHLDDVMTRRTGWRHYHRDAQPMAAEVAGWMAEIFGWDKCQEEAEVARAGQVPT